MDIVAQIQAEVLDDGVSLSSILRKAKVLAAEVESDELALWARRELGGYPDVESLPDYRRLRTSVVGTWTDGFAYARNRALPLDVIGDKVIRDRLSVVPVCGGIRSVEEYTRMGEDEHAQVDPELVRAVNSVVAHDGFSFWEMKYTLRGRDFAQVLDSVRNHLLDFVIELRREWDPMGKPPASGAVREMVRVNIYNSPQGGSVSVYDQRGQQVQYQYNAAGNINIDGVGSPQELAAELAKLRSEIDAAKGAGALSEDAALESQHALLQASRELDCENAERDSVMGKLAKAKDVLVTAAAASGLVKAVGEAIEAAKGLLRG